MRFLRYLVPALLSGALLIVFLVTFAHQSDDPTISTMEDHITVSIDPENLLTPAEYERLVFRDAYRERQRIVRRKNAELQQLIAQKISRFECYELKRKGRFSWGDTRVARDLAKVAVAYEAQTEPSCFRNEWSGIDSGGTEYVLIDSSRTTYLGYYPSELSGGPRIFETEVEDIVFGYIGTGGFTDALDELDSLPQGVEYKLRVYYQSPERGLQYAEL